MKPISLAYYSHDTFGMGHISRASKIINSLNNQKYLKRSLLITGCAVGNYFPFPQKCNKIWLPSLYSTHTNDGTSIYLSRDPTIDTKVAKNKRRTMTLENVSRFKPDVFIVDTNIRGIEGELDDTIIWLKKHYSKCLRVALFRDIIDSPEKTIKKWTGRDYFTWLEEYFDLILIGGKESIFNFIENYGFKKNLKSKSHYIGYIKPPSKKNNGTKIKSIDIIVSFGGGWDGGPALRSFIEGLDAIQKNIGTKLKILVLRGPYARDKNTVTNGNGYKIIESSGENLDLQTIRKKAKLSLSMCGYNTFCEIFASKHSAIVIPREFPEEEQLVRAQLFDELNIHSMYRQTCPDKNILNEKIINLINSKEQAKARKKHDSLFYKPNYLSEIIQEYR
ncbi:MAG: glycosyltransferase family protein [Candidatus Hodarchaeota archaeon]